MSMIVKNMGILIKSGHGGSRSVITVILLSPWKVVNVHFLSVSYSDVWLAICFQWLGGMKDNDSIDYFNPTIGARSSHNSAGRRLNGHSPSPANGSARRGAHPGDDRISVDTYM